MSEKVTGYIDHVIFRNDENGYTVMVLKTADSEEELTCVGTFPDVTQGVTIEAEGQFSQHHIYGRQFNIQSYAEKAPEDTQAMERYLGSGAIKGVGAALAARIVRCFGEDTLRIVEEEPERLAEVKGISEKKAREIAVQVTEKADMRKAMMFLQKYGISLNLGAKIGESFRSWDQGSFQNTGNTFDFALSGSGLFSISFTNKAGETSTLYTRDGSFQMNREGYLVTKDGDFVLGENGPIQLPTDFEKLTVEESGEIYADGQYVDRFALVDFENYDYVEAYGENLYRAVDGATQTDATATVNQGYLEASNINVVTEMVDMISIARDFESNQKIMNTIDEMLGKMVSISEI